MGYITVFVCVAAFLAASLNIGDAVHGPEIEVPFSEMSNFVSVSIPLMGVQLLGVFLSKKYFAAMYLFGVVPPEFVEIRFGDLSTTIPLVNSYFTEAFYGVGKVCNIRGNPVSLNPGSFPDHTQNFTADYFYSKLSENKYFKRSIDFLANDRCMDDQIGTEEEGDTFDFDFEACIAHDISPGSCTNFYDTDWVPNGVSMPWAVYNNQPIGNLYSSECDGETDVGNGTERIYKLIAERDVIIDLTPPGGVSLP